MIKWIKTGSTVIQSIISWLRQSWSYANVLPLEYSSVLHMQQCTFSSNNGQQSRPVVRISRSWGYARNDQSDYNGHNDMSLFAPQPIKIPS